MQKAIQGLREILLGRILPKPYSLYRGVAVNRCRSDGQLITYKMPQSVIANHAGHYIISPVVLTLKEKILIWLKLIQ